MAGLHGLVGRQRRMSRQMEDRGASITHFGELCYDASNERTLQFNRELQYWGWVQFRELPYRARGSVWESPRMRITHKRRPLFDRKV